MKTVKYSGPHRPGVELVVNERARIVEYLHETDVPDDVAAQLVEQDPASWSIVARGEQLHELNVEQLQQTAERDSIAVEGTGAGGRVLKGDLIAAIEAHRANETGGEPDAIGQDADAAGDDAGENGGED